ncbi:MAG: HNH endonuclease [Prevotella sp.]|nr:HNH endonuclease [Prevotella sp.]MBO5156320.1 HNH endonuclease [Prevotella sp.]
MFNEEVIKQVWDKANVIDGYNPSIWRKDYAGAWIRFDAYGSQINFGWEIDHMQPVSKGGDDSLPNLFPLHWQNNRKKNDDYPEFYTSVSSIENRNIEKLQSWKAQ